MVKKINKCALSWAYFAAKVDFVLRNATSYSFSSFSSLCHNKSLLPRFNH